MSAEYRIAENDNLKFSGVFLCGPSVSETEIKRERHKECSRIHKTFSRRKKASKKQRFIVKSGIDVCSLDKLL